MESQMVDFKVLFLILASYAALSFSDEVVNQQRRLPITGEITLRPVLTETNESTKLMQKKQKTIFENGIGIPNVHRLQQLSKRNRKQLKKTLEKNNVKLYKYRNNRSNKNRARRLDKRLIKLANPDCKKIECPSTGDPVCAKLIYKNNENKKPIFVIMINECEIKYLSCHKGVDGAIVPMKNCHPHFNKTAAISNTSGIKTRPKRDINPVVSELGIKSSKRKNNKRSKSHRNKHVNYKKPGKYKARRSEAEGAILTSEEDEIFNQFVQQANGDIENNANPPSVTGDLETLDDGQKHDSEFHSPDYENKPIKAQKLVIEDNFNVPHEQLPYNGAKNEGEIEITIEADDDNIFNQLVQQAIEDKENNNEHPSVVIESLEKVTDDQKQDSEFHSPDYEYKPVETPVMVIGTQKENNNEDNRYSSPEDNSEAWHGQLSSESAPSTQPPKNGANNESEIELTIEADDDKIFNEFVEQAKEDKENNNNPPVVIEELDQFDHFQEHDSDFHSPDYEYKPVDAPIIVIGSNEKKNETDNRYPDEDKRQNQGECPSSCPDRNVMVCSRCKHGIYRTFQSVCHMRMFTCRNKDEKDLQLVSRTPCVMSAPLIISDDQLSGRVSEPGDTDPVLKFIRCREKNLLDTDPNCRFNSAPEEDNAENHKNEDEY